MALQGDSNEIRWGDSATSGSNTAKIGISRVWEDKTTYEYCKVYVWIYTAKSFYDSNNNLTLTVDGETLINEKLGINVGAGNTILKEAEINFDKQSDAREVIFNASLSGLELVDVTLSANRPYVIEALPSYTLDVGTYIDGVKNDIGGEVTFDVYLNGVLNSNDVTDWCQSVSHGTTYSIKDIKPKAGYVYNGVHSGSLSGTVKGTTSVYLSVSKKKYTIQYDANGGEGSIDSQTVKWKESFALANNVFTRNGYTFSGFHIQRSDGKWSTCVNNLWATRDEIVTNDYGYYVYQPNQHHTIEETWCDGHSDGVIFTLYAQWQPNTYTITFNGNGGETVVDSLEVVYETIQNNNISQYIPVRQAYEFLGWYSSPTGGVQVYDGNGLCTNDGTYWLDDVCVYTDDYELYAQWKALNIAYYKHEGEWKLYRTYIKVDNTWNPAIMYIKSNNKYIR